VKCTPVFSLFPSSSFSDTDVVEAIFPNTSETAKRGAMLKKRLTPFVENKCTLPDIPVNSILVLPRLNYANPSTAHAKGKNKRHLATLSVTRNLPSAHVMTSFLKSCFCNKRKHNSVSRVADSRADFDGSLDETCSFADPLFEAG
jgi:hypothetical protein